MTGEELCRIRERLGLSKTRLAGYLGVNRFHVANLEAGRRRVTSRIEAVVRALAASSTVELGWSPSEKRAFYRIYGPPIE
jgi:DNA-binding transcriptional regulator YiaG